MVNENLTRVKYLNSSLAHIRVSFWCQWTHMSMLRCLNIFIYMHTHIRYISTRLYPHKIKMNIFIFILCGYRRVDMYRIWVCICSKYPNLFMTRISMCSYARRLANSWWRHQMETFFRVIGLLCGEFTAHRCIHLKRPMILWSGPEQAVEQAIETAVIWNAIALIVTSLWSSFL